MLPEDIAIEVNNSREQISLRDLPTEYPIYDVGLSTSELCDRSSWGHPVCCGTAQHPTEKQNFAFGTIEVLNMCVETTAMTIIGGGHTSALVEARGSLGIPITAQGAVQP